MFQIPQDASAVAVPAAHLLQPAHAFGWVDQTALAVLFVFFVLGLFKGLIWQVSRIAILAAAYIASEHFGRDLGAQLAGTPAAADPALLTETAPTTLYLAYVLIFLGVLIVLSLTAMLLQRLATKAGLGFFDRLGGGVFGVLTGACVVLFGLFVLSMFARGSPIAEAAATSHSGRISRKAIDWLGTHVNDDLRVVLDLAPLQTRVKRDADLELTPQAPDGTGVPNDAGAEVAPVSGLPTLPGDAPAPKPAGGTRPKN